jgi:preprotein translocase subunit Sec61beta
MMDPTTVTDIIGFAVMAAVVAAQYFLAKRANTSA